ncbi:MAG TPA: uracil-DNA glycosylase [Blastocatellia bacterium]|nr:uracil-DNA glycosylase [Blastocatellia bacterium]
MSKEIFDELAGLARQLEEQLKFYREIGLADIGGSGVALKPAPEATFRPHPPAVLPSDDSMPKKKDPVGQESLFADLAPDIGEAAAPKVKAAALPVIEIADPSLEAIREDIGECTRCKLHKHRTNIVFGEGNPAARLVFVGEGPGADEDATGRPFVGRAGQLLDKIIAAIGMKREDVYIANVVKCRPPGNRTPERDEVATCEQFLFRQIALIRPQVIVALGSPAFQCLLRTRETITKARGEWREWNGIKVLPTFHPAYLLRSPEKKREAWEDMKKVRDYLNSLPG